MRTKRFVCFLTMGLVALAVAQPATGAPCTWVTPAPGPSADAATLMMVAPLGTQQNDWDTAALKGCLQLKSLLTAGNSKLLGFDSPADASLAQIGMPFDIYTVGIDKLRDYLPGKPVEPLFEKIDARFYPLSVAGEVRSSLVVSQRRAPTN